MKLKNILSEGNFSIYRLNIRISYADSVTVEDLADMVRAIPGVLIVKTITHKEEGGIAFFQVKILTSKKPEEAILKLSRGATRLIPSIKKLDVSKKSLTKMK